MRDEDNGFVDLSDWLGAVPDQPEDDVASDASAGPQSSTPGPEPRPEPAPAPETQPQPTPHLGDSLSVALKSSAQSQGSERGPRVSRRAFVIGGIAAAAAIVGAGLASGASEGGAATGTLDHYTWGELSDIANQIAQADSSDAAVEIAEGHGLCDEGGALNGSQTKSFQLADGTWALAQVIGFCHDRRVDGSGKTGITFITADCVAEHAMNDTETNSGGWEASQMRSWMNSELLSQFPDDLRSVIVPVAKFTNNVGATEDPASVTATHDSLWLPSMVEIVGEEELRNTSTESNIPIYAAEGSQYRLFSLMGVRWVSSNDCLVKRWDGTPSYWWKRSAHPHTDGYFSYVESDGYPGRGDPADVSYGVAACFCL